MPISTRIDLAELELDPYPAYARMRREAPVAWCPDLDAWFVTRQEDCRRIAGDPQLWRASNDPALARTVGDNSILACDGQMHADLRSFVDPQLRPKAVSGYIEGLARPIAESHLADIREAGRAELMADYFEPVSVRAVGDLLGLRDVSSSTLRNWFHALADGMSNQSLAPKGFEAADAAVAEIKTVIGPKLERLIAEPDDSALSHWLHDGMPPGETRPVEYVYPTLFVILTGGLQEPGHGAANTLLGLATRPAQLRAVKDDPELAARAVVEGLRWLPPIGVTFRKAATDVTFQPDATIEADQIVVVSLAAANRDPDFYEDPDRFDLHRNETAHIAFGLGDHLCSGHFFARHLERIALEVLLSQLPDLELDDQQSVPVRGWVFRTAKEMHASW